MISNKKIDKIGNKLKDGMKLSSDEHSELLDWRNSYSSSLDYYYGKLKTKIPSSSVVVIARRLKRIESIQIKLKRFSTMRLSTFQDIAGLRAVLVNSVALDEVFTLLRTAQSRNTLKKIDNYHSSAKEDGYRGIHLIYKTDASLLVEIQLRTEFEHIWSTAVETYGLLQETSFKTGDGEEQWKEFFKLLSSYFAIKENCSPVREHLNFSQKVISSKLKKSIKSLNVIERLNAATNSIKVITKKYNDIGRLGKYALVELNLREHTTSIEIFNKKDVSKAIEIYTRKELQFSGDLSRNIVFVNIENTHNLQRSYPNYFLDTQRLLEILSKIILGEF